MKYARVHLSRHLRPTWVFSPNPSSILGGRVRVVQCLFREQGVCQAIGCDKVAGLMSPVVMCDSHSRTCYAGGERSGFVPFLLSSPGFRCKASSPRRSTTGARYAGTPHSMFPPWLISRHGPQLSVIFCLMWAIPDLLSDLIGVHLTPAVRGSSFETLCLNAAL